MDASAFLSRMNFRCPNGYDGRVPLKDARQFLDNNEGTDEARALRRLIRMLGTIEWNFTETDVWSYSLHLCPLISALVAARLEEKYTQKEWGLQNEVWFLFLVAEKRRWLQTHYVSTL